MKKLVIILIIFSSSSIFGQDITPPELTGFSFTPDTVNVSSAADTVFFTISATDDLSGLNSAFVTFRSNSGNQHAAGVATFDSKGLSDTVTGKIAFEKFSESGLWLVEKISLFDKIGNEKKYLSIDLLLLKYNIILYVNSNEDIDPPELKSLNFSPDSIDVTQQTDSLTFTISGTDSLSGLDKAFILFKSPSGDYSSGGVAIFDSASINDTAIGKVGINKFTEPGSWYVDKITLFDVIGNKKEYKLTDFVAMGFPYELKVNSNPDSLAPELVDFSFLNDTVDISQGSQTIKFTVSSYDSGSGLSNAFFTIKSPLGNNSSSGVASFESGVISATDTGEVKIERYSEPGEWKIDKLSLFDIIGNEKKYSGLTLEILGFPTTIYVKGITVDVKDQKENKYDFALLQNYPNPFNPTTTIKYSLPETAEIEIKLYNVLGEQIKTLFKGEQSKGFHQIIINGNDLSSGVYFYELKSQNYIKIKKCILLR